MAEPETSPVCAAVMVRALAREELEEYEIKLDIFN